MRSSFLNNIPTLQNTDVTNKRCLVRVDFNVPVKDGRIVDQARILAAKPTIDYLLKAKAKIILLSHFSRIKSISDVRSGKKSLFVVAKALKKLYPKYKILFVRNNTDKRLPNIISKMKTNQIILLENTRYNDVDAKGKVVKLESKCNLRLAKFWAKLGDVYVNDAFATIHRGHASNAGIAKYVKNKCIGFLIQNELENIIKFDEYATKPIVSIIGGAKIADKISLLKRLMETSDQVLIGGAMANTFLVSQGIELGNSKYEKEMLKTAADLYAIHKDKIILPIDLMAAKKVENQKGKAFSIDKFPKDWIALDIGPKTIKQFTKVIKYAKTVFWNGPMGMAELENFAKGSNAVSSAIAITTSNNAFSLVGGGDTIAAATKIVDRNAYSFISTGGGATLAVIADDKLPGLFKK